MLKKGFIGEKQGEKPENQGKARESAKPCELKLVVATKLL